MSKYYNCDLCNGSGTVGVAFKCPKCDGKGAVTLTEHICAKHIGEPAWAAHDMKIVCIEIDEHGRQIVSEEYDA